MDAAAPAITPQMGIQQDSQRKPVPKPQEAAPYGLREDKTPKGEGYFGSLPRADNSKAISGELSVGVHFDGKETLIPTMVPTLTKPEFDYLMSTDPKKFGGPVFDAIVKKAADFAMQRMKAGKPVWALPGEKFPVPTQ